MYTIVLLVLLLITPEAYAGFFDPAPQDESVQLLGTIFGSGIGSIYLGGTPNSALSDMMEMFNFVIVSIGGVIVSYVGTVSTIHTAHEGAMLGKSWSAIWIPIRSIAGVGLMLPSQSSGYSLIQISVAWIVMQGILAADEIWTISMQALQAGLGTGMGNYNAAAQATLNSAGQNIAQQLLNAQICMSTFNAEYADPKSKGQQLYGQTVAPFAIQSSSPSIDPPGNSAANAQGSTVTGTIYFGIQSNPNYQSICGQLPLSVSVKSTDYPASVQANVANFQQDVQNVYNLQVQAITAMLSILQPLASGLVANGSGTPSTKFPIPTSPTSPLVTPTLISQAIQTYSKTMIQAVVPGSYQPNAAAGDGNNMSVLLNNFQVVQQAAQAGIESGWVSAGGFYFLFNRTLQSQVFSAASNDPSKNQSNIPDCSSTCYGNIFNQSGNYSAINDMTVDGFVSNIAPPYTTLLSNGFSDDYVIKMSHYLAWGYQYFVMDTSNGATGTGNPTDPAAPLLGSVANLASSTLTNLTNYFQTTQAGTNIQMPDPIMTLSAIGTSMMISCEGAWVGVVAGMLIVSIIIWLVGVVARFFSGGTVQDLGGSIEIYVYMFVMVMVPIIGLFWTFGATLAIFVPLIPYIIFVCTAMGWLLLVVEAIIAAPIVALGLTLPEGDELGKLEAALGLLTNIFLRPSLMILGFILAARIYAAVIVLINTGIGGIFQIINVNTMFSSLMIIAVYTSFIVSIANVSFSLIYALPNKVLRWMGGVEEKTDVSALNQVKSATEEAAGQVSQQATGAVDTAGDKWSGKSERDEKLQKARDAKRRARKRK